MTPAGFGGIMDIKKKIQELTKKIKPQALVKTENADLVRRVLKGIESLRGRSG